METPRFVRRNGPGGPRITFVTITSDGREQELTMWDLLNKHGAERVLQMREQYPEVEEEI
jgi:hypothetical protein